jgi:hypothetical protein
MRDDIAEIGFTPSDLFRLARIEYSRGYKFLSGCYQSARTADVLTRTLRKPPGHYLIRRAKRSKRQTAA